MGVDTIRFFRQEMERTWGSKHLAVFDEEEARNYVLGVSIRSRARPRGCYVRSFNCEQPRGRTRRSKNHSVLRFQSIRLLRVSADLKAKANLLCKEALQSLTVALAGTDTKSFWDLLTAYFGANHSGNEEDDPWDFLDAAPTIPPPLPLTETESEDEKASVKSAPVAPTTKVKVPRKPKISQQKDLLDDLCSLKEAICMYPVSEDSLKETGIPPEFQVKREHQTTHAGGSVYLCPHPKCQTPPFFAQSPAGIYSHIRRKHLGIALACPYCADKIYWNSKGWRSHMNTKHHSAPHFGATLADEAALAQEMLRTTERRVAPSTDAPKKRRVCKKPTRRPLKEAPAENSSSSSSDEGTVDSSPDSSSSSGESSDTETTSASRPSKCQTKSKSSDLAPIDPPLAVTPLMVKQEPGFDPGLEDMPELEEKPPAPFPPQWASAPAKKRQKEDQE